MRALSQDEYEKIKPLINPSKFGLKNYSIFLTYEDAVNCTYPISLNGRPYPGRKIENRTRIKDTHRKDIVKLPDGTFGLLSKKLCMDAGIPYPLNIIVVDNNNQFGGGKKKFINAENDNVESIQNNKINELKEIYAGIVNLSQSSDSGLSFSDIYMRDHLGWDTCIKHYFLMQGLSKDLFVLTAFNKRRKDCNKYSHEYESKIEMIKHQSIQKWNMSQKSAVLSHGMSEKPSEFMLDLCWFKLDNNKIKLAMELEQSRSGDEKRCNDILFDFYKLVCINSELKIMISFPWQHQVENLTEMMMKIIQSHSDDDGHYLIVNISEDNNRGKAYNRTQIDYEIHGLILNRTEIFHLEKHTCICLWK